MRRLLAKKVLVATPLPTLLDAMQQLSDALAEHLAALATESGLSVPSFRLLFFVIERGPMRITELVRHGRDLKANVARLVRRLESAGLVRLRTSPRDGRVKLVEATEEGHRRYQCARRRVGHLERSLRARLGAEDEPLERLCVSAARYLGANDRR